MTVQLAIAPSSLDDVLRRWPARDGRIHPASPYADGLAAGIELALRWMRGEITDPMHHRYEGPVTVELTEWCASVLARLDAARGAA